MDAQDTPRIARQRFRGEPDEAERDAFAERVVERAGWFTSPGGRFAMSDRNYRAISVASGMVASVLELAEDAGMSPLQVLEQALLSHIGVHGSECAEFREVHAQVTAVLDRADAAAAAAGQAG